MRKDILSKAKRIVIKIGSRVLTTEDNGLDPAFMVGLSIQVAELRRHGHEVIIVTSGAIAAGRPVLGLSERPRTIPQKQAAAAVGQTRLMRAYEDVFAAQGLIAAQILLTRADLADRMRFLNARSTIETLLECGAVPVINENDTVVVDEIKFGDNDNLSALVTNLVEAQLLVILTDIDGFYDADPRSNPDARLVSLVRTITRDVERAAGSTGSTVGTGGMATKVAAAKKAAKFGVPTLMANGKVADILIRAMAGEEVGTLFLAESKSLTSRKHWIAYTLRPQGKVIVDEGAVKVLAKSGRSLLPSGVVRVEGEFDRGDCVRVCGPDGAEFARGIVAYSHKEIALILGHRSSEIEDILGYRYGDELIHRDNLVVL
ncbi:MAG: glutamate 5-kinase [Geobacter sp.]|nr:glutamate 5-kinase [Geobacter sp.]